MGKHSWVRWLASLALVASGCQGPSQPSPTVPEPRLTLDMVRAVEALGARPNALWQDALFTSPAVQARREAARFSVLTATAVDTFSAAPAALPSASTNGVAYAHFKANYGVPPQAGDVLYEACDNGTIVRYNPASATGAVISPNFNALSAAPAVPGNITRSAVMLSGDNARMYLLTTSGYFVMLDAKTGTRLAAFQLSQAGFSGIAPFIDYSNGGGAGYSDEHVYAVSRDGSVYRVRVLGTTAIQVRGWRVVGGTDSGLGTNVPNVSGTVPVSSTVTASITMSPAGAQVNASPIAWNGDVFYGTNTGRLCRFRTSSAAFSAIQISTWPIETTPAVDFDASMNVSDVFMPGGDRVHWIDATGATLARKAISPALVLDKKPASASAGASGVLKTYPYTTTGLTTKTYTAADWASATTSAPAAGLGPSSWGNGRSYIQNYPVSGNPTSITRSPVDGSLWVTTAGNKVQQIDPTTGSVLTTYDGSGNYAALVKTIPVGLVPAGLTPDPINGGVYVSCYGSNNLYRIDAAGNTATVYVAGIPNPTGLWYDDKRDGNAANDEIWVCSTTGPTGGPATGKLYRVAVGATAGTVVGSYDNTNTDAAARNWNAFGGTPANNTALTAAAWKLMGPQGVTVDANGKVWVANTAENLSVTGQNSGQTPSYPFTLDGTGSNASDNGVNNDRSSVLVFDPATAKFTDRIVVTGAPYGMDTYQSSVWIGTYRWGQDVVERYGITRNAATPANSFQRLYRSTQTSNHWQPRWVAVDSTNDRCWVVNGNSSWPAATATNGLDAIKASSTNTGNNSMAAGNANFLGTYTTGGQPRGVDTDSLGNVWASNSISQTCTKYSASGAPLGTYPVGNTPYAVACDKFDVAWVANRGDGTVSRLTPSTLPPSPLTNPKGVAVDLSGNLYITNAGDNTVTALDATGNAISLKVPTTTSPGAIAVGPSGNLVVSSTANSTVNVFPTGIAGATTNVTAPGSTNWSIIDGLGRSFSSITNGTQVTRLNANGTGLTNITVGTDPQGMCWNPLNNDVWVANRNSNNVSRLPAGNGPAVNYAVGSGPRGVAIDGEIGWVANTSANSVMRFNGVTGGTRVGLGTIMSTLTGFSGSSPQHMVVDGQKNAWVINTTNGTLTKFWFAGAQDLVAAANYQGATGPKSYAYTRFLIGANNFNGQTPYAARLQLRALTNSGRTTETLEAYRTGDAVAGALWDGYKAGASNVDWNTAPSLGALEGTSTPVAVTTGTFVNVPLSTDSDIIDVTNTPYDAANGDLSYAFSALGTDLADAAHWSTASGAEPRLQVDLLATRISGSGLRSQPTIDSARKRIFVMGTNAVFELRYDSVANFKDSSKIAYSFTNAGVAYGPVNGTNYVTPTGATTLTYSGRLVTLDYNPTLNQSTLSAFKLGAANAGGFYLDTSGNNTVQLARQKAVSGTLSNQQITYDYDAGSVYVVGGTTLTAVKLLQ